MHKKQTAFFQPTIPALEIRIATPPNGEAITVIAKKTYQETYPNLFKPEQLGRIFHNVTEKINDPNNTYIIAELDGVMIGYARIIYHNDVAMLDKLYLLQNYQGYGYGKQLFAKCCQLAVSRGYNQMNLMVWEKNTSAISFYEKFGFVKGKLEPVKFDNEIFFDYSMSLNLTAQLNKQPITIPPPN